MGRGYRDLVCWEKSMAFAEAIYRLTERFDRFDTFGLISQLQRSSISVASNIAEGAGRSHRKDFLKHLSYARGSLAEAETQLELCVRTKRLSRQEVLPAWQLAQETGRLLTSLMQSLSSDFTRSSTTKD